MSVPIEEQEILNALRRVPVERWDEVLRFVTALNDAGPPIRTGEDLSRSELVGAWAGRDDLGDSREFARDLRRQAENRRGATNAAGH